MQSKPETHPQHMRLVAGTPLHALEQRPIIVLLQTVLIIRVGALLNDKWCTLAWGETAKVSKTLFRNDDVQVVFYRSGLLRNRTGNHK